MRLCCFVHIISVIFTEFGLHIDNCSQTAVKCQFKAWNHIQTFNLRYLSRGNKGAACTWPWNDKHPNTIEPLIMEVPCSKYSKYHIFPLCSMDCGFVQRQCDKKKNCPDTPWLNCWIILMLLFRFIQMQILKMYGIISQAMSQFLLYPMLTKFNYLSIRNNLVITCTLS